MECYLINEAPNIKDPLVKYPAYILSGSDIHLNTKRWKMFEYPFYVLDSSLASIKEIHHKYKNLL